VRCHTYYVYILTNDSGILYVGVTNDLERRLREHELGVSDGFTRKYRINTLIYFEDTNDIGAAIEREKQIKRWRREKKIALVRTVNPEWRDLGRRLGISST
jgi:putative endonuclease